MNLSEKIQSLRAARGLTRRALSDLTGPDGITEKAIYEIEHGRREPTLATLRALAAALGTTPSKLLRD